MELTPDQVRFWYQNGYVVLENFFSEERMDSMAALHEKVWRDRPAISVDHLETGKRSNIRDLPRDLDDRRYKLNDLYVPYEEVREVGLDRKLVRVLEQLMVDPPVLINSLSLDKGTQQGSHVDSLYMTPPTPFALAAAWVALEDAHPDAGPLEYYPGSHMIWPYRFSTGSNHAAIDEMDRWQAYMDEQIERFGLRKEQFVPKKGDVLIWHSYLLHGGGKVKNPDLTRKSLVTHYFAKSAVPWSSLRPLNGAYWYDKEPIFEVQLRKASQQIQPPIDEPKWKRAARTTLHHVRQWRSEISSL